MITHYVPQWLLKKFRGMRLYELDIFTGNIAERNELYAGSGDALWPDEIEHRLMSLHDNRAAQIYRKKIAGQSEINLTSKERVEFSRWLALFCPRVPGTAQTVKEHCLETDLVAEFVYENRDRVLRHLKADIPAKYAELVDAVVATVDDPAVIELVVGLLSVFGSALVLEHAAITARIKKRDMIRIVLPFQE